jgi:DNA-binding winged helix-turn-helix (wHTH) protein/tetratricopeptide (TPR) repeat protein
VSFSHFILDADEACLYLDGARIALSPKDCALLYHLAANAGRVVAHAELLRVVWGDTAVSPDVLKVRIARIRRLLGDAAGTPRFIANAHGEGYRFMPPRDQVASDPALLASITHSPVVGREREIGIAVQALHDADEGRRQLLFVTGNAGIGKTTLIDSVVDRAGAHAWVGRGHCIEHYGNGEPYLPVMEALSGLGRHGDRRRLTQVLERYAPSWLLQLPTLLDPGDRTALQQRVLEPHCGRMLRELAEALEALDTMPYETPAPVLVLVLEDLHWADASTLDLLRMLGRRRERARLLVVASYRPFESTATSSLLQGVVRDLCGQRLAQELLLESLGQTDVRCYLDHRFQPNTFPPALADRLHERTAGHPLFLAEVVRDLCARDTIVRGDVAWRCERDLPAVSATLPTSVRQLLAKEQDALSAEDRRVMQVASIAGFEFTAAAVAAALQSDPTEVEERCLRLARDQRFLRVAASEEWPDGTHSMRFAFLHELHQELWRDGVGLRRGEEWHRRIAERQEAAYGERAPEIAPALAIHFERGGDHDRAIAYRERAAALAMQRAATAEAKIHLNRAIEMLPRLADSAARERAELRLRIGGGTASVLAEGFASHDARTAFQRAYEIYQSNRDATELLDSMFGMCRSFWIVCELGRARELSDQMQVLVRRGTDPVHELAAHVAHGTVLATQGEFLGAAAVLSEGRDLARTIGRGTPIDVYAGDLEVICTSTLANTLQIAGYPDQAARHMQDVHRLRDERHHPVTVVCALYGAVLFHRFRGDTEPALVHAECLCRVANDHELPQYMLYADMHRGWALAAHGRGEEGMALLKGSVDVVRLSGADLFLPDVLALLAEASMMIGSRPEARDALDEALAVASRHGYGMLDAELHRLDGELLVQSPGQEQQAEAAFTRAIEIARRRQARSWELRAALSLAKLWRQQGDENGARTLVSSIYRQFTEGFDSRDLKAAEAFIA